jgi:hypothetical protein
VGQVATQKSVKGELLRGYVKGGIQFMITNTLDIFASSAIKALITLNMLKTEKVGDLDTIDVLVNAEEVSTTPNSSCALCLKNITCYSNDATCVI